MNEEECNFKKLMESLARSVSEEVKKNISPQVCFVCLLHLANEKGIDI